MDPGTCPTTTHLDYQHVCDFHAFAAGENSRAEAWTHITVDPETGEPVAVDPFYAFAPVGTGDPVPEREDGANVIEYDPDVPPNNCSTWYYEWSYRRFRIYAGDPDNEQMHGDHAVNSQYFYQHGAILPNVNCDWCDEEVGYWDELNQRWVSGRGFYYPYGDGMGGEPSAVTIAWKTGGGSASGGAQTGSVLSYGAN
ncbi:MAG: hypothetical protein GW892_14505 [Armatimonadetes bacterium]|nr:hypothetical protein [Armatimonadota bacterium]NCQ31262.1 hypothetical protein [Armatimonadota bacterium]